MWGRLDLQGFTRVFGQRLVVSDFHDKRGHIVIKHLRKFMLSHGVSSTTSCRKQAMIRFTSESLPLLAHQLCYFNQMIDVRFGRGAFTFLPGMGLWRQSWPRQEFAPGELNEKGFIRAIIHLFSDLK